MEMTLRRFLYLSMNFSNVGSLNLDATYWAEVVFDRMNDSVVGCFKMDSSIFKLLPILAP